MPSYTQYMRQMAVMDANDDDIESWITVKGNHIPIKKGQSKEDAVKSFIAGKKENLVENHNSLVEAMNLEEKGYFKKDPRKRDSITQSAIEMGKEEKNLEELMEFGVKEANSAKSEKKENGRYERPVHISEPLKDVVSETKAKMEKKEYPAEFETVRKNAKANPNLYGGRYTQKSKSDAYKQYKADTENKEPTAAEKHTTTRNLLTMFGKHYDDLYEGKTKRNPALVKEFDDKMANDPEFKKQVQAFVRERGDLLTSDREVEAYMLAHNTVKNKLEPANKKLEEYHKKDTKEEGVPVENPTPEQVEEAVNNFFEEETEKREKKIAEREKQESNTGNNFFNNMNAGLQSFINMTGYEPKTTFWSDFSIAEPFGEKAIRDTYKRAFKEWKNNKEYVTELVMMLNWKIWHHNDKGHDALAHLYDELWREADEWCMKNLKGDDLKYYIRQTD